jgi:hypothetical protein
MSSGSIEESEAIAKEQRELSVKGHKKGVRIKIQPRFKIQYPMKNRSKDRRKHPHLQHSIPITLDSLIIFHQQL